MRKRLTVYILFALLAFAVSVPTSTFARRTSAQRAAQKNEKKMLKQQKKQRKRDLKTQKKATKEWRKHHSSPF